MPAIFCPMNAVLLCCRSESLSQAILDSLTDIDPDSIQRSSSAVTEFLDETHALVAHTQQKRDKARASESVHELAKVPGMLQSSILDHSECETTVDWLISIISNACTPGMSDLLSSRDVCS